MRDTRPPPDIYGINKSIRARLEMYPQTECFTNLGVVRLNNPMDELGIYKEYDTVPGIQDDPQSLQELVGLPVRERCREVVMEAINNEGPFIKTTAKSFNPLVPRGEYYESYPVEERTNLDKDIYEYFHNEIQMLMPRVLAIGFDALKMEFIFDVIEAAEIAMDPYVLRAVFIYLLGKVNRTFYCFIISRDMKEEFIDALTIIPVV